MKPKSNMVVQSVFTGVMAQCSYLQLSPRGMKYKGCQYHRYCCENEMLNNILFTVHLSKCLTEKV